MTRLLVSVRDAQEAEIACVSGVDLIDVKEPSRGALGAADAATLEAIAARVGGRRPLSVALGELCAATGTPIALPAAVGFAKIGLAGCAARNNWVERWRQALTSLPPHVAPVAVAYADWKQAQAPLPLEVVERGARLGCRAALIDTYTKQRGTLLDHLPLGEIAAWIAAVAARGMFCVVAGSLGVGEIERLTALQPDYVGVRGAACGGGRTGAIEQQRIGRLLGVVRAPRTSSRRLPVSQS